MSDYLDKIESSIKSIESIDFLNDNSHQEIEEEIQKIGKIPIIIYKFPSNSIIYRARINFDKKKFSKISEITYPKPQFVKNYARVNKPKQSIFYCSENRPTSYLELATYLAQETKIGDKISITISGWMLVENLKLILIYDPESRRYSKFHKLHGKAFDAFIEKTPKKYREGTYRFFNFIGSKFSEYAKNRDDIYKITSTYSDIILSRSNADGIIYPSISLGGDAFNIALLPEVMDDNKVRLMFTSKDVFDIKEINERKHHFVEIERIDGKINYELNTIEWNTGS